ncbi:TIM barrel protein [Acidovorax sp. PRC11]|uniref:sugar phosphate isomerase/epimerase family protein n=1 Tax=Acidovorax sp. PRC11 TaxID=2962592 RepID=UPI002881E832|nr:TIM barrel protein [Acidovorax sp. PRC11]MDT0136625.1 TIM barrel protein [Acidovorax sp. PRC11]
MRLAISNIAWERHDDLAMSALLNSQGIDAIDIAPGKYFPQPASATEQDIKAVKAWWADRGIAVTGMQALLFGTTGLNVFGSAESQEALLKHLDGICRIGGLLHATRIVFGSPKNRDRSGLNDADAMDKATAFFRKLGDSAARHGVMICLEPNPARYGANFMCTADETATVVTAVAHPAIRMQLDTGALAINGENVNCVLQSHAKIIGHIHASEPDLLPLGDGGTAHATMAHAISRHIPDHLVTIEMVATKSEPPLLSVARALEVAKSTYGSAIEGVA